MSSLESNISQDQKQEQLEQELQTPPEQQLKPQQENAIMVAGQPTIKQTETSVSTTTTTEPIASREKAKEDEVSATLATHENKQHHQHKAQLQLEDQQQQQQKLQTLNQQQPQKSTKHQFLHTMPINTKILTTTSNVQHAATISCNNQNHMNSPSFSTSSSSTGSSQICRGLTNAQVRKFSKQITREIRHKNKFLFCPFKHKKNFFKTFKKQ